MTDYQERADYSSDIAVAEAPEEEVQEMVWEVETEPAPQPQPQPQYNAYDSDSYEDPYADAVQDYGYSGQRTVRYSRSINKHLFTWLFSFMLGLYGADRFCRGQIGLGILKLCTFGGFGIWYLADFCIAAFKSYAGNFSDIDDLLFDRYGNYVM